MKQGNVQIFIRNFVQFLRIEVSDEKIADAQMLQPFSFQIKLFWIIVISVPKLKFERPEINRAKIG